MAEFPSDVLLQVQAGNEYFSNLADEKLNDLKRGCIDCEPRSYRCLQTLMIAINHKVFIDSYDDAAKGNVEQMLTIIGDYTVKIPPTVSAGADQVVEVGTPAVFTANITLGSGTLVSVLWEKISGGSANLSGANTAVLTVSNFSDGQINLKVTVVDSNGLTASDTVMLTGTQDTARVAYWSSGPDFTIPSYATITGTWNQVAFLPNGQINFPFLVNSLAILKVAYPSDEPIKNRWSDIADLSLFGPIGTDEDTWGAGTVVSGAIPLRVHTTNFLTTYNKAQPSGIRFQTV